MPSFFTLPARTTRFAATLGLFVALLLTGCTFERNVAPPVIVSAPNQTNPSAHSLSDSPSGGNSRSSAEVSPEDMRRSAKEMQLGTDFVSLPPLDSGPGLIIADPTTTADSLTDFGAGCGRWLHFTVAGYPHFGKTPDLWSFSAFYREKTRSDFRVTPAEAKELARMTGVTHTATGEITGSPAHCKLTYRLWEVPAGRSVGATVGAEGTIDAVAAQLPQMAAALFRQMRVVTRVPKIELNPAELAVLGRTPGSPVLETPWEQGDALAKLAKKSPVAGLWALRRGAVRSLTIYSDILARLLKLAPDNALAFSELRANQFITGHQAVIEAKNRQYPHNAQIAYAKCCLYIARNDKSEQIRWLLHTLRCAPREPFLWVALGSLYKNEAERVRRGRFLGEMSAEQQAYISRVYAQLLQIVQQATALDPLSPDGLIEVSTAAAFSGNEELADAAFQKGFSLLPSDPTLLWWGLELYQPKWLGSPEKLARIVQVATAQEYPNYEYEYMAQEYLFRQGYKEQAYALRNRCKAKYEKRMKADPDDKIAKIHYRGLIQAEEVWQQNDSVKR